MRFSESLAKAGYTRFTGVVDGSVYRFFKCPHPRKARWWVHVSPQSYQCSGCAAQCETDEAAGFQTPFPGFPGS
jgi:hypothetical protein